MTDVAPMAGRFEDVGASAHLAKPWFADLLRDGFALTASGTSRSSRPSARRGCDGDVSMIGSSSFGSMQVIAAVERPPSLKAILVSGGHNDFFCETTYTAASCG